MDQRGLLGDSLYHTTASWDFFPFFFFSSIIFGGGGELILEVHKADTNGWEMNGIWMHDVKDGKDK